MEKNVLDRGPALRFAVLILAVVGGACGGSNGAHDAGPKDWGNPHQDGAPDQNSALDAADGDAPQDAGATDAGPDAADGASQEADAGPDASALDPGPQGCNQGDFNSRGDQVVGLRGDGLGRRRQRRGDALYSTQQAAKPELRLVRFVAQNFDTDNDISVSFDNFRIEGSCAP